MSKGCLITLIIVGILLILVVIAAVTCYVKREELAEYGTVTLLEEVKRIAVTSPQEGVDTTQVKQAIDHYIERLRADEGIDMQQIGLFMQSLQSIPADNKLDSAEARQLMESIRSFYPNLHLPDSPMPSDTSLTIEDTVSAG